MWETPVSDLPVPVILLTSPIILPNIPITPHVAGVWGILVIFRSLPAIPEPH